MPDPVRIVILGGGFAGISTAMELSRLRRQRDSSNHAGPIEVHLVCEENYFVFQPLLPEVVACALEPSHILNPIRHLCPHVQFHCASVQSIDVQTRTINLVGSDTRRMHTLQYDHLVVCLGLTTDLSHTPGMTEHSLPLKTLGDAFHLRNHVLSRLEEAEIERDDAVRKSLLTFVVVGGGFSGVETVAEINDMIKTCLRYYPRSRATGHRMILIHPRDRILLELKEGLAHFAEAKLRKRGVELILNTKVVEVTSEGVVLSNGSTLASHTVICTVGNAPHPLIKGLPLPQEDGRLKVSEFLRVLEQDNIWALGDAARIPDLSVGRALPATSGGNAERRAVPALPERTCPPTAQYAMREGRQCARNLLAVIHGHPLKPFIFHGLGQLAVVGHRCGVAQVMGIKISGLLAWFMWRTVYFAKLPGLRSKVRVGLDWLLDLFFPRDITKLQVQRTEQLRHAHFARGERIIRQGEIGDRFYIIESGEVDIVREENGVEHHICTRGPGDSFGEIALLQDTARTATVRCLSPVNVLTFSRADFQSLIKTHSGISEQLDLQAKDRMVTTGTPQS